MDMKFRSLLRKSQWLDKMAKYLSPQGKDDGSPESLASGTINFGLQVAFLVFGVFGLWAAFAPLDSAAVSNGVVVVDTNRKVIQHLEGGIVDEILVRDGDVVKAGQPLVRLSETAARARTDLLRAQYYASKASEARLIAERDKKETIEFSDDLLKLKDENHLVAEAIDTQTRLFESRRKGLEGQVGVLNQRIAQSREEIIGLQAQENAAQRQIRFIEEEVATVRQLLAKGNALKPRLLALERESAQLRGRRGEYLAMVARAQQNISESELSILNVRNEFQNKVVQELKETQVQLSDLEERMRASEDILNRIVITAPQDGVITGMRIHTKGGVISPGERIMEIVPSNDRHIIECQISPQDIDVVRPGLPARVRMSAYKSRKTPQFDGEVTQVSADKFTDERTGQSFYLARIEVDQQELDTLPDIKLYPGMPAEVLITTGERTLLEYLLSPFTDTFNRAFREQ
jgi:HlyD family type I secretion membrane fusion protein